MTKLTEELIWAAVGLCERQPVGVVDYGNHASWVAFNTARVVGRDITQDLVLAILPSVRLHTIDPDNEQEMELLRVVRELTK